MDPWYKVATPRKEVREGRSFNPDEFAIALEQVVAGTARLAGKTEDAAPVLTLITQFAGAEGVGRLAAFQPQAVFS
jgi:hypothetical protein